jgi:hypothetical protein
VYWRTERAVLPLFVKIGVETFTTTAANSPHRAAVTAMAQTVPAPIGSAPKGEGAPAEFSLGNAIQTQPELPKRSAAHYL